jgi:hypothetical protein
VSEPFPSADINIDGRPFSSPLILFWKAQDELLLPDRLEEVSETLEIHRRKEVRLGSPLIHTRSDYPWDRCSSGTQSVLYHSSSLSNKRCRLPPLIQQVSKRPSQKWTQQR